ncbi:hypothetical protein ACIOG4_37445 [Streptomyces microflavus]|uniref:hypothetical protein n=1 Tax=Streptomyces microflavus TaxID=1919 RepID=UPI0037FDB9D3
MNPALTPLSNAPYGHGLTHDGSPLLHELAEPWQFYTAPARPNALFAEDREPSAGAWARTRCERIAHIKADPADGLRPCPTCALDDDALEAWRRVNLTRVDHPVYRPGPDGATP